jgi:hypothetical protein
MLGNGWPVSALSRSHAATRSSKSKPGPAVERVVLARGSLFFGLARRGVFLVVCLAALALDFFATFWVLNSQSKHSVSAPKYFKDKKAGSFDPAVQNSQTLAR